MDGFIKHQTYKRSKLRDDAQLRRSHPSTAKHADCGVPKPPEALFSWNEADLEIYIAAWSDLSLIGTVHICATGRHGFQMFFFWAGLTNIILYKFPPIAQGSRIQRHAVVLPYCLLLQEQDSQASASGLCSGKCWLCEAEAEGVLLPITTVPSNNCRPGIPTTA